MTEYIKLGELLEWLRSSVRYATSPDEEGAYLDVIGFLVGDGGPSRYGINVFPIDD